MNGDQLSIDDALGDVIPSRATDPETSHAAEPVKIKAGSQRAQLLAAFYFYGSIGQTDEQAMNFCMAVSPTSEYSKRCSELRDAGYIEPTGDTRRSKATGKQRIVSRITPKGRAWIEANQ